MRAAMLEIADDGRLVIGPCPHADPRTLPAQRIAAIGADRQPGPQFPALGQPDAHPLLNGTYGGNAFAGDQAVPKSRQQSARQVDIGDIVAERVRADLASVEDRIRRPQQPAGAIDDPQRPERRGSRAQSVPDSQPLVEQPYRSAEQRGRAPVGPARIGARSDADAIEPSAPESERSRKPGRARSDHDDIVHVRGVLHHGRHSRCRWPWPQGNSGASKCAFSGRAEPSYRRRSRSSGSSPRVRPRR